MTTICHSDTPTCTHGALQRVAFASCYVYSPTGTGVVSERSRVLRELLKSGEARSLLYYADHVRREVATNAALAGFLNPTSIFVPVPGRAPCVDGERSVAERLATALIKEGLGLDMWRGLRRIRRIRKSATALPGERPTVDEHHRSFAIESGGMAPSSVVLVDDVVTKGRTLLAAAMCVHEAFPATDIRAFALLRTLGFNQRIDRLMDPCIGEIRWRTADAHRRP
jgi:hypothetical protein